MIKETFKDMFLRTRYSKSIIYWSQIPEDYNEVSQII
jgi:hypothetical protein